MRFKTFIYMTTLLASVAFLCLPALAAKRSQRAKVKREAKFNASKLSGALKDYTILNRAIKETRLHKALAGGGPYVIFAPTDKAFRTLPQQVLNNLFEDPEKLRQFLLFHIVRADLRAEHVSVVSEIETMSGSYLKLAGGNGKFRVNDTEVNPRARKVANGIVYKIEQVLFPID